MTGLIKVPLLFPELPALPSFVVASQEPYKIEEVTDNPPRYSATDLHRQLFSLLYRKDVPGTRYNEKHFRKILRLHPQLRADPGSPPVFPAILIYTIWPNLKLAYIDDIQVHTLLKRRKLGSYLLDRSFRDMSSSGVKRAAVLASTTEGYSLLTYNGFKPLSEERKATRSLPVWLIRAL